jgi:hypothetical protein
MIIKQFQSDPSLSQGISAFEAAELVLVFAGRHEIEALSYDHFKGFFPMRPSYV